MEKKKLTVNLEASQVKKLKILAVEKDKTATELLSEAIQDLLKKYAKSKK